MTVSERVAAGVAMTAICDRCGIDLYSNANCALEGYPCLGDEGELDRHLAEIAEVKARKAAMIQAQIGADDADA